MIRNLEPKSLWNHFADLNAVPRGSKKEERVVQFMLDFGKSLGLDTKKDAVDNVIIKKPATKGMEDRKTIILQSHLDMVHQKNNDTEFNFDEQGIEMIVEGDWVRANGTTLGADNGIGVAAIMALLSSSDIPHPAIEAMFTIDEETGMTGAIHLDPSHYSGEILLNLDTEDDDELSIGCAGGIDTNTSITFSTEAIQEGQVGVQIQVKGLLGGHSGMDIDKGRGNANKLMNRLLVFLRPQLSFSLVEFDGGSLRNAIPREATAVIALPAEVVAIFEESIQAGIQELKDEYATVEPGLAITWIKSDLNGKSCLRLVDRDKFLDVISAVHNGVFRMSPEIEGLVEASSSLARVLLKEGAFTTQSLQRSSVESSKKDVANTVRAPFDLIGCEVTQGGEYPGWRPNPNSEILQLMRGLYEKKFNENPQVKACHAGLECGILQSHLPGVDMISFGPNIRAAHSPDEKVQISSVQKFWDYLQDVLTNIPKRG